MNVYTFWDPGGVVRTGVEAQLCVSASVCMRLSN